MKTRIASSRRRGFLNLFLLIAGLCAAPGLTAQVVTVTVSLDTNRIAAGASTTLRVFAQIAPDLRPSTDRIFSWYVDVLNSNGTVARGVYESLQKPASDNDPRISSAGTNQEANRRGIYDTFMNLPDAGRPTRVLLVAVPVTGLASGRTTFRVQAGTGVAGLGHDFIVAPAGGGDPLLGGDYSLASAELEVLEESCRVQASLAYTPLPGGQNRLVISYALCPGQNHFVEFRDSLGPGTWQTLPSGPHNSGSLIETNSAPQRFYRLRITPP